jgi:hypothetical protein
MTENSEERKTSTVIMTEMTCEAIQITKIKFQELKVLGCCVSMYLVL